MNWKTHRREPWDLSLNDAMSRTSDRNFDYKARGKTSKHATEELQIVLFKEFGRNHLIEEKSGEQLYNYKYKRTSGNKSPFFIESSPAYLRASTSDRSFRLLWKTETRRRWKLFPAEICCNTWWSTCGRFYKIYNIFWRHVFQHF